jgi:outer membrane protein OmpA-like peptidoglycan-associated protein
MPTRTSPVWIIGVFFALALSISSAQETALRTQLFTDADEAMRLANEALANILAPGNYDQAAEHYRTAETDLARGRNLDNIRRDLSEAVKYFSQATAATTLARVSLGDAIAAREDAEMSEAAKFASEKWREAEAEFADAARRLEDGNINRARRVAEDARAQYREAELLAIETNYLSGARRLIAEAKDERVDRYAPKTLGKAESLLAEAETRLRTDRYDTDYPRSLAREANYEARHSMHLAERIKAMSDRDVSAEDLLLEAEVSVTRIAGELDLVAELDEGFDKTTTDIVAAIGQLEDDRELLSQRNERVAFLEDEMSRMEARLGDESEQRKLQEQIQQRFEQIAAVFTRDEAVVLRRGNDVIIRMGLNFDSGSPVIKPEYFGLLRKIQTAIDVFPDSQVEIQGHTDSFGADEFNRELSERRASAVQQYLLANMDDLGQTQISAVGYGETVPLANNETPEGRTRNRRIDLLISPNMDVLIKRLASE